MELKVQSGGVISKIPSSAVVKLRIKLATLVIITANSVVDGLFTFNMSSANTIGYSVAPFEVEVTDDWTYVIGKGNIILNKKLV
jgi:hypothetical protein